MKWLWYLAGKLGFVSLEKAFRFNQEGLVASGMGKYPEALSYFQNALAICQGWDDQHGEGRILGSIGYLYLNQGLHEQAHEMLLRAMAVCQTIGDREGEALTHFNLAQYFRKTSEHRAALNHYNKALAIAHEIGNRSLEQDIIADVETLPGVNRVQPPINPKVHPKIMPIRDNEKKLGHLRERLALHQRNLEKLKLQAAKSGGVMDRPILYQAWSANVYQAQSADVYQA